MRLIAHIDGGGDCRPETDAYVGVSVSDLDTGEVVAEHSLCIGPGTHIEAEWSALIHALRQALELGATELWVRSDSTVVVNQVKGNSRVRAEHLRKYHDEALRLARLIPRFELERIPRTQNKRADALATLARKSRQHNNHNEGGSNMVNLTDVKRVEVLADLNDISLKFAELQVAVGNLVARLDPSLGMGEEGPEAEVVNLNTLTSGDLKGH